MLSSNVQVYRARRSQGSDRDCGSEWRGHLPVRGWFKGFASAVFLVSSACNCRPGCSPWTASPCVPELHWRFASLVFRPAMSRKAEAESHRCARKATAAGRVLRDEKWIAEEAQLTQAVVEADAAAVAARQAERGAGSKCPRSLQMCRL
jgi:hypothetical protein